MSSLFHTDIKPMEVQIFHHMIHLSRLCTIYVHQTLEIPLYCKVLTDFNPLGRHLELWELPKDAKVASCGFLLLNVLSIIISQNIFYIPQIQVHQKITYSLPD